MPKVSVAIPAQNEEVMVPIGAVVFAVISLVQWFAGVAHGGLLQ